MRITLNVGGKRFATTSETLFKCEFFKSLHDGEYLPEEVFLDLNPRHFDRILGYLRHGSVSMDGLNAWECYDLRANLKFLGLTKTIPYLKPWAWVPIAESSMSFTKGNTVVSCHLAGFERGQVVWGDSIVSRYTVQWSDESHPRRLEVGLVSAGTQNKLAAGYFLAIASGSVIDCSKDSVYRKYYHPFYDNLSKATVKYCHDKTIHFHLEGQDLGPAFYNVLEEDLIPIIRFGLEWMSVAVLE
ncbi:unnamed protein product [Aphanomyces euteiches]